MRFDAGHYKRTRVGAPLQTSPKNKRKHTHAHTMFSMWDQDSLKIKVLLQQLIEKENKLKHIFRSLRTFIKPQPTFLNCTMKVNLRNFNHRCCWISNDSIIIFPENTNRWMDSLEQVSADFRFQVLFFWCSAEEFLQCVTWPLPARDFSLKSFLENLGNFIRFFTWARK